MALGRKPLEIVNDGKHQLLAKADHWSRIYLKQVAKVQNGYAFSSENFVKSGGMPLIRIRDIDRNTTVDRFSGKYPDDFIVKKGDILIGMDGDFKVAKWKGENALLNQRVCRIIPNNKSFDVKFLFICIQPYLNAINEETSSVTVKHLSSRTIEDIPLPYPPLLEQLAIVSKIEELFSELDKGVESLKTAQQQLKVYRQSLLKWAFEGKLTAGVSTSLNARGHAVVEPETVVERSRNHHFEIETTASIAAEGKEKYGNNDLPEGWKWVKIDALLTDKKKGMSTGPFGTMLKKGEHQKNGVPVLGIENIGEGLFQMPNKIFITNEKAFELKSFRVKENDIIISRSGTVGEICLLPKKMENSIISTNLIKVSLNQEIINPKFFVFLFQGGNVRQQVFDLCKGSSRAFLNQTILKALDFPFCQIGEQQLIVDELESKFTVCDKIEETITNGLQQSEALRQSILKKAFEGKLV